MTGPNPVRRRWTHAEETQLQDMLAAGMTAAEVAKKLKRTRRAIYDRLHFIYRTRYRSPKRP